LAVELCSSPSPTQTGSYQTHATATHPSAQLGAAPQELYRWPAVAASARVALGLRYRLLPYLYTSHYAAAVWGGSVAKPVFFADPGAAGL
jgi:alpha-glucosidase (family GH31 glycosyl hydrolase)